MGKHFSGVRLSKRERWDVLHALIGLVEFANSAKGEWGHASPRSDSKEVLTVVRAAVEHVEDPLNRAQLTAKIVVADSLDAALRGSPAQGRPKVWGSVRSQRVGAPSRRSHVGTAHELAAILYDLIANGPGVAPGGHEWIFRCGASAKRRRGARLHGIGLALVRNVVGQRSGWVAVSEGDGGGVVFTVHILGGSPAVTVAAS
ncbi:ATP-binding protein [Streptomyces sp. NPDC004542]|uniref:ATP-binding protein n=1 Tax=Streptomyces sp. NPDC004542 TaxID=3154281 RepID=UPI0033A3E285